MEKQYLLNVRKLSLTMSELTPQMYYLSYMKKLHAADATRRGTVMLWYALSIGML